MAVKNKIFVIYYSMYGHVGEMARKVKSGIDAVEGCEGVLYQVKETLPQEVLTAMHAPPQDESVPIITADELTKADGFVFGFPTRFGGMPGQFKSFWDSTGGLWQKGALYGKPFGIFVSAGTLGGGQEVTIQNSLSNFVHHGMVYVPQGYGLGAELFNMSAIRGGSPWGAGTFAGSDGSLKPAKIDLEQAVFQGKRVAEVAKKLA